jgi:uncharacterized protein (TIGR03435 family)
MRFLAPISVFVAAIAMGQTGAAPAFEAASIKPNNSALAASYSHVRPDNLDIQNESLHHIVSEAFGIQDHQLQGPDWMRSERFDIVAKASMGAGNSGQKLFAMLQTLVVERFKLQTHRETKEFPVLGLVAVKSGFKLQEVSAEGGSSQNSSSAEGGVELKATRTTMQQFAGWISRTLDRPVVDMTGIQGEYAFVLKYAREEKGEAGTMTHPVLPLAIQEQLGLRLEKRTAPIQVVVVDHVEKTLGVN